VCVHRPPPRDQRLHARGERRVGAAAIIIVVFAGFASGQLVAFQEMGNATHEMHGVLGHDGLDPADLRARGRAELGRYGVGVVTAEVQDAEVLDGAVRLISARGADRTRTVLLADGHARRSARHPRLRRPVGHQRAHLPVLRRLRAPRRAPRRSRRRRPRRALFFYVGWRLRVDVARTLGCRLRDDGSIAVDSGQATTVDRVYAAGNCADPRALVAAAAGSGVTAAVAINARLSFEDADRAVVDSRAPAPASEVR
jgi:thioredoxin reductase